MCLGCSSAQTPQKNGPACRLVTARQILPPHPEQRLVQRRGPCGPSPWPHQLLPVCFCSVDNDGHKRTIIQISWAGSQSGDSAPAPPLTSGRTSLWKLMWVFVCMCRLFLLLVYSCYLDDTPHGPHHCQCPSMLKLPLLPLPTCLEMNASQCCHCFGLPAHSPISCRIHTLLLLPPPPVSTVGNPDFQKHGRAQTPPDATTNQL